jgi:pSer/pThr/pTyr-binding forkhead associated (FHA) protein
MMHVKLIAQGRQNRKQIFHLHERVAVLGRGVGNAVRIPSAEVSRRHCRLFLEDGLVTIEDLDSVNGTFLNGLEVVGRQFVHPGDQLEVGPVVFKVEYDLTPQALSRMRGGADFENLDEDIPEALDVEEVEEVEEVGEAGEMEMEMEMEIPPGQTWDDNPIPVGEENVLAPDDDEEMLDLEILDLDEDH